jgi:hypothetical protein
MYCNSMNAAKEMLKIQVRYEINGVLYRKSSSRRLLNRATGLGLWLPVLSSRTVSPKVRFGQKLRRSVLVLHCSIDTRDHNWKSRLELFQLTRRKNLGKMVNRQLLDLNTFGSSPLGSSIIPQFTRLQVPFWAQCPPSKGGALVHSTKSSRPHAHCSSSSSGNGSCHNR